MTEADNENVIQKFYDDFNNRDFLPPQNSWNNYLTDSFNWIDPRRNELDRESITKYFAWLVESFPDVKASIEIIPSKGNTVVVKYTCSATFSKDFEGYGLLIPAHGKKFSWDGLDLYEFEEGKIKFCQKLDGILSFRNHSRI